MSMVDSGAVVGTIGNMMALGIVAGVANNTMKSVSNSYRSNERSHRTHGSHKEHMFSMQHHPHKSSSKKHYSIWEGTGF